MALGLFAAVQTFILFARRDRFAVLFWWTKESWLLVTLLWLKDLALAAAAFFVFFRIVRWSETLPDPPEPEDSGFRLRHALLFAGILAAGVAMRWVAPRQIPPGVWGDAPAEVEAALREPGRIPWFGGRPFGAQGGASNALVSYLYVKFCELLFRVFGRGDVGILALSAVGGSLALPAVFWLGREIAGRRVALIAMTLSSLAMSPLVFSRWAYTAAMLLPLVLAAAAAALRAIATGRVAWAILAGLLLGLSLHTYVPSWAVAAGFGVFASTMLSRPERRKLVFAGGIATFAAFLPFGISFLEFPGRLGGRARDVSFLIRTRDVTLPGGNGPFAPPLRLLYNAVEYSGVLLWTGDPNPKNGIPGRPAVSVLIGVAALAGTALSWRRARSGDPGHRLLLAIAGASLLAGIFSDAVGSPSALRVYPFVGASILLAAFGFVRWVPASARALPVRVEFLWALGFSLVLVLETVPFFAVWPDNGLVGGSFCPQGTAAGRLARNLAGAPTILDPQAIWPIVFETLAAGRDPDRPVPRLPRRTAADLLDAPPREAFWYVARRSELDRLRGGTFHCARGVSVDEATGDTVIARVVPASR
ncbi:MAG TPA: glycosyltransferase family 39 protein [Thermoanaerobaculia bacterium]